MLDLSQTSKGQGEDRDLAKIFERNLEFSSQFYVDDDQPESLPSRPCVSERQVTSKVIKLPL